MIKSLSLLTFICLLNLEAAQTQKTLAKDLDLNFAVPELPAFKIIDKSEDDVLRPTSIKALSVMASQFNANNLLQLPQNIGFEISPMILMYGDSSSRETLFNGGWKTLFDHFRISFATYRPDSTNTLTKLGVGARWTPIDYSDLRRFDTTKVKTDGFLGKARSKAESTLDSIAIWKKNITDTSTTPEEQAMYSAKIDSIKAAYKKSAWNLPIFDISMASAFHSIDGTGKTLDFKKAQIWATIGLGFGDNFQWISGVWGSLEKPIDNVETSEKDHKAFGFNTRFYLGNFIYKSFMDGSFVWNKKTTPNENGTLKHQIKLGTEFKLPLETFENMWAVFEFGVESEKRILESHSYEKVANFKISYGI